jgi:hypothetical protein
MARVSQGLEALAMQIAAARQAQTEYETVDQRATPPRHLTTLDQARHRSQWRSALQTAHETLETALRAVEQAIVTSTVYVLAERMASENDGIQTAPTTSGPAVTESVDAGDAVLAAHTNAAGPAEAVTPSASNATSRDVGLSDTTTASAATVATTDELEQATSGDHQGAAPADDESVDVLASPEQHARVVSLLLSARAYATADVFVQALQRHTGASRLGDHALVVSAAIETIRRLRNDTVGEAIENAKLRESMEQQEPNLPECDAVAANLGVLSAGLCEMVFPSPASTGRWTFLDYLQHRFGDYTKLQLLIKHIAELEGFYIARDTLNDAGVGAGQAALNTVSRMRARARRWHADESLYRNWTATDYKNLHQMLFRNEDYPIARCLALIARGEDQKLPDAFREARKKFERPLVTIQDIAKRIGRRRPFDGVARGHITSNIEQTRAFIEEYLEAVNRANEPQTPVPTNVRTVLQALYQDLSGAIEEVEHLPLGSPLSLMHRDLSLTALHELKRVFDCAEPSSAMTDTEQMLLLRLPLGIDLKPSLAEQIGNGGFKFAAVVEPFSAIEEIHSLAHRLRDAGDEVYAASWLQKQLESAGDDHLKHGRLLPVRAIDQRLGRAGSRGEHVKWLNKLNATLQNERQRTTHAMALGALTQSEASRMLALIEELVRAGKVLDDASAVSPSMPDFPHAFDALLRLVTRPLEERLRTSRAEFFAELELYAAQNPTLGNVDTDIERIRALALERSASSIRAARDMFSLLKEGALPKRSSPTAKTVADQYKEFIFEVKGIRTHRPLIPELQHRLGEAPTVEDPAWLARLDVDARRDASAFLESWEKICSAKSASDIEVPLTQFFRALQPLEPSVMVLPGQSNPHRIEFFLNGSPFARLDRAATGVFIPPNLGSDAQYVEGIVLRQTPSDAVIKQAVEERCQSAPHFVMGRGSWSLEKRAALSLQHPVLLVDDVLVAYAALHPQQRLKKLMEIALLTFSCNPYGDHGRAVPPEMFFGRRTELRNLRDIKLGAILYGGRRLGKSSLLDQLQRDAQNHPGERVVYLTLDRADRTLSEDHEVLAWNAIRRRLLHFKILQHTNKELKSAIEIRQWIEDEIMAGRCSVRKLYLLIDEADELMGLDLHARSPFISAIHRLCESVKEKCAIRFVIAGLHNLTRMANEENSALGKFESIALKPFWSAEDIQRGIELIKIPLEALGFHFAPGKEDMPLRIMAVCNFYPAFIQMYCRRLIDYLNIRRDRGEPPTIITEDDLEKVEHDKDFLRDIRYKFKLNLDLDKRYAAIALVLADQYYSDGAKHLSALEVRELCDVVASRHFEKTGAGAYTSLLEEMETLTILERVGNKYGLRTPNIAMMLGDRESVSEQLQTLSAETSALDRSHGERRSPLMSARDRGESHLFPLPNAWIRQSFSAAGDGPGRAAADSQLLVFVGNELSGLSELGRLKGEWQLGETTATLDVTAFPSAQVARNTLVRSARMGGRTVAQRRIQCVPSGAWKVRFAS